MKWRERQRQTNRQNGGRDCWGGGREIEQVRLAQKILCVYVCTGLYW